MAKSDLPREGLVRRAFLFEILTLAWMFVEAGVALGAAIGTHSLTLMAFGADSVIELLSALLLLWRLHVELRLGQTFSGVAERHASRISGGLLGALALYIVISAAWGLWSRHSQALSLPGLVLAATAIPIMFGLARVKLRLACAIGSAALRADAVESITCGYLSAAVLAGLGAQWLLGAWWIDSVSALVLVPLLIYEAREAWET